MPNPNIRCYDNGGKNAEPFHPQGIGMSCTAMPGRHLGRRIALEDLPADCRRLVAQDLGVALH